LRFITNPARIEDAAFHQKKNGVEEEQRRDHVVAIGD